MASMIGLLECATSNSGCIPQIYSKGVYAENVLNFYKSRYDSNISDKSSAGRIDACLIISRGVDYLSTFQTTKFSSFQDYVH